MENKDLMIEGRNAVLEVLKNNRPIDKILIQKGQSQGSIKEIIKLAKRDRLVIQETRKEKLDGLSETGKHQGVIAFIAAYEYSDIEDMFGLAKERNEDPFIVLLDGIVDPHNFGAIIRSANLAGAHGVVIPKRRSVGLTSVVAKTSAGALEYTPIAKVSNIAQTIDKLKEKGVWIACADMGGETIYNVNLKGPMGIVIGNEGDGISNIVRKKCDYVTSIPMKGNIDSLNASVAAGILMFEVVRQRAL